MGGRLCDASAPNSVKHPVIIPKEHHLTKLLIADCHEKMAHQGKGLTINEIRSRGFWITGVNRTVASFVRQCVRCRKLRRPTEEQKMANLPSERIDPSPPFTYSGMDVLARSSPDKVVNRTRGMDFSLLVSVAEPSILRCWMTCPRRLYQWPALFHRY